MVKVKKERTIFQEGKEPRTVSVTQKVSSLKAYEYLVLELANGAGVENIQAGEKIIITNFKIFNYEDIVIFKGSLEEMRLLFELVMQFYEARQKYHESYLKASYHESRKFIQDDALRPFCLEIEKLKTILLKMAGVKTEYEIQSGLKLLLSDIIAVFQLKAENPELSIKEIIRQTSI